MHETRSGVTVLEGGVIFSPRAQKPLSSQQGDAPASLGNFAEVHIDLVRGFSFRCSSRCDPGAASAASVCTTLKLLPGVRSAASPRRRLPTGAIAFAIAAQVHQEVLSLTQLPISSWRVVQGETGKMGCGASRPAKSTGYRPETMHAAIEKPRKPSSNGQAGSPASVLSEQSFSVNRSGSPSRPPRRVSFSEDSLGPPAAAASQSSAPSRARARAPPTTEASFTDLTEMPPPPEAFLVALGADGRLPREALEACLVALGMRKSCLLYTSPSPRDS